jgi:putative ABC transport system permease protein
LIRLASLFGSRRREEEMAEELESHLEMHIEDNLRAGMTPQEARRHALIQLGGLEQTKEICRDRRGLPLLETSFRDCRYALRMLGRERGFTGVAIVTLALGIGANSTIFTLVNGCMLRPPRIKEPGRVVAVLTTDPARGSWGWDQQAVSAPDFVAWREQSRSFENMVASELNSLALTGEGEPEQVVGMRVSADYFQLLGVDAARGRTFLTGEDQAGRADVVILSDGLWQRRFASDARVIGKTVSLDGARYTVAGIMPGGFRVGFDGPQLWVPLVLPPERLLPAERAERRLRVLGRLKPGVTVESAKAEVATLARRAEQVYPGTTRGWGGNAMVLQKQIGDEFKVGMGIQMGAVLFVLLIACANIATLQLTRVAARQTEIAVRTALGASRLGLMRQLLIESMVLALLGGGLGLIVASWGVSAFRNAISMLGDDFFNEIARELTIDRTVVAYTIGISSLAAVLFGLFPAFVQTAVNLHATLKEGGRTISQARPRRRALGALVSAQIALALTLLTGAGLMMWGFLHTVFAEHGMDPKQVLTARIRLTNAQYKAPSQQAAFFRDAIERLEGRPDVLSAGGTTTLVGARVVRFTIKGHAVLPPDEQAKTGCVAITPGLLETLRVPLLRGRSLGWHDNASAPSVVVVNEAFARRFFPDDDPLGKHVRLDTGESDGQRWSQIVAVAGSIKLPGEEDWEQQPVVYKSYFERPSSALTLVVRTASEPASFAPILRRTIWSIDADQPISHVQTMEEVVADIRAAGAIVLTLLGSFASLALAMAVVAVFGVVAYTVAQRTNEIGIRIALGARAGDVLKMTARRGLVLGAIGVGIGGLLAVPLAGLPTVIAPDMPINQRAGVLIAAGVLLLLVALLASYIPARRATRIDPTVALRCE